MGKPTGKGKGRGQRYKGVSKGGKSKGKGKHHGSDVYPRREKTDSKSEYFRKKYEEAKKSEEEEKEKRDAWTEKQKQEVKNLGSFRLGEDEKIVTGYAAIDLPCYFKLQCSSTVLCRSDVDDDTHQKLVTSCGRDSGISDLNANSVVAVMQPMTRKSFAKTKTYSIHGCYLVKYLIFENVASINGLPEFAAPCSILKNLTDEDTATHTVPSRDPNSCPYQEDAYFSITKCASASLEKLYKSKNQQAKELLCKHASWTAGLDYYKMQDLFEEMDAGDLTPRNEKKEIEKKEEEKQNEEENAPGAV